MIALLQRVSRASVTVGGVRVAAIDAGLLVFAGVLRDDDVANAERLAERVVGYRVFPDTAGKMNLSVKDTGMSLLIVPQFTLVADTASGTRPSFTPAAEPSRASTLFDAMAAKATACGVRVERGVFGADMKVDLTNDGPVTFWLEA